MNKWLANNTLYVADENIKKEIVAITHNKEDKIIVINSKSEIDEIKEADNIALEINKLLAELPAEKQRKVLEYIKDIG